MDRQDMAKLYLKEQPFKMLSLQKYLGLGKEFRIFAGESLNTGDSSVFLYYIRRGAFRLCVRQCTGELNDYCYCREGTTIQINQLLIQADSWDPPSVIALENSDLTGFSRQQFYDLIRQDADVFNEYIDITSSYSTLLKQHMIITSRLTAGQRLLTWLDKLCSFHDADPSGTYVIPCSLTQQQIADYLFIHLTTCNKLLQSLTARHIIRREKTKLYVFQRDFIREHLENPYLEF